MSLLTSAWSLFLGDRPEELTVAVQIQQGADALGRLTPFIVLMSVLVEPARIRGWSYVAMLVWAGATVLIAVDNFRVSWTLFDMLK